MLAIINSYKTSPYLATKKVHISREIPGSREIWKYYAVGTGNDNVGKMAALITPVRQLSI